MLISSRAIFAETSENATIPTIMSALKSPFMEKSLPNYLLNTVYHIFLKKQYPFYMKCGILYLLL